MESGMLDVLVMEKDRLQAIGASGRLMDLEEQMHTIYEQYEDRLVYCKPLEESYEKEYIPVGIELSDTILTGEGSPYAEGAALGRNDNRNHDISVEMRLYHGFISCKWMEKQWKGFLVNFRCLW